LQHFKDELAQRNLNFLVEAAIERDEPTIKKSTPAVKRKIHANEKDDAMA
jgi:hypothetical protein